MNKKLSVPIVGILALSLGVWGMGNMKAQADPATVVVGFGCGLFDGDGGTVFTTDTQTVITVSKTGVVNMKCQIEGVDNNQGKAVHYSYAYNPSGTPVPCVFEGTYSTSSWKETVSDNGDGTGDATLQCKFRIP